MRELLIKWLGIYQGQIDAYEHIRAAIDKYDFDAEQIKSLCGNMIKSVQPNIERDQQKLDELNKHIEK